MNKRQRGFTLVETMIAATILAILLGILVASLFQTWRSQEYIKLQAYLKNASQETMYKMSRQLAQSKRLISNNTLGTEYLDKLPVSIDKDWIVLPTVRQTGALIQERTCMVDKEQYFWPLSVGNALYFVELAESFKDFTGTTVPRQIDIYQFRLYYVAEDTKNRVFGLPALELREWRSQKYADYEQYRAFLADSPNGERSAIKAQIEARVEALWDSKATTADDGFVQIMSDPAVKNAHSGGYLLKTQFDRRAALLQNTQNTTYSLAYNKQTNSALANHFPLKMDLPLFYQASPSPNASTCDAETGDTVMPSAAPVFGGNPAAFPGGFEVMVVGPNGGRSVMTSLTFVASGTGGKLVEQNHQTISYAKDY